MDAHRPAHLDELARWLERERPVALGECGLDFYIEEADAEGQRRYFSAQLELAREFDLPVILHARRAVEEVTLALRRIGGLRGVVHSFSGSEEQARQLWELGFLIGMGGPVTWPRARRLRRIVADMPLQFLLLETDAPDQPLVGRRGRRNEPALLREVCQVVADLRGEDFDHVAAATSANARRLFGLSGPAAKS
jgi:TatD DNase family protein